MSLNSQRNLNKSQRGLATALNRLSSGLRINSAKDDAAGLAISERFTSQIRGLSQAARNANDGISLAQTAEGALNEVGNMLQRIRELAVQSANSTNSATDRVALQDEVIQLKNEIQRISSTTSFNGSKLLDGTFSTGKFQVGSDAYETIDVSIGSTKTSSIGSYKLSSGSYSDSFTFAVNNANEVNSSNEAENYTINGKLGSASVAQTAAQSAYTVATNINNVTTSTGVTADAYTKAHLTGFTAGTVAFTLNGEASASISAVVTSSTDLDALANAINNESATTGINATVSGSNVVLEHSSGYDIKVSNFTNSAANSQTITMTGYLGDSSTTTNTVSLEETANDSATVGGQLNFRGESGFTVVTDNATGIFTDLTNAGTLQKINAVDVSSVAGSNDAMFSVDAAIASVSAIRSKLGALQSRFESAISNIQTGVENLSAARSRIQDADFAQETAELTRTQILQQAGTAMLAQANSIPQNVLSLLG